MQILHLHFLRYTELKLRKINKKLIIQPKTKGFQHFVLGLLIVCTDCEKKGEKK